MHAPVLLTGATGYIGGRLLRRLEDGGRAVRCLVRQPGRLRTTVPTTEIVQGDCLDEGSFDRAPAGVQCAYYLVHSMGRGSDFAGLDRRAAEMFARAARRAGVRRIVYLGGLTDETSALSAHLKSRVETGALLRASGAPVIEFRASVVIGAGSLICPRWVDTLTQPIASSKDWQPGAYALRNGRSSAWSGASDFNGGPQGRRPRPDAAGLRLPLH